MFAIQVVTEDDLQSLMLCSILALQPSAPTKWANIINQSELLTGQIEVSIEFVSINE